MSEFSLFWPTGTSGDGQYPYTDAQLFDWLRRTFNSEMAAGRGPLRTFLGELEVTGGTGKVLVASGAAYVYGIPYVNDATVQITIPIPPVQSRTDRIVLRADWTEHTVRITRIAGTEGGGPPPLTQVPGSIYDVELAQVYVTPGGVITVTDKRQFCRFATEVSEENIADGAIIATKIGLNAVVTEKIASLAVTSPKIADGAVTSSKIPAGAILTTHIANGAVSDAKIAGPISQSKISNSPRTIDADMLDGLHIACGMGDLELPDVDCHTMVIVLNNDPGLPTTEFGLVSYSHPTATGPVIVWIRHRSGRSVTVAGVRREDGPPYVRVFVAWLYQ